MNGRAVWRRVFAGVILFGFSIASVLFWNGGSVNLVQCAINLAVASAGLGWLHFRWRAKERRELTPSKVKDIFS